MKCFNKAIELLVGSIIAIFLTTSANATLELRLGGKAVYDTVRDTTWLADPSAASPNAFDNGRSNNDGEVTYYNAVDWLANLNVYGVTGWGATEEANRWYNDSNSEVDFLIDELEKMPSFYDLFGGHQAYWAVGSLLVCGGYPCPHPDDTEELAIGFILGAPYGLRSSYGEAYDTAILMPPESEFRILAMHGGDVFAQIPQPTVILLIGAGLIGLVVQRRKT